MGLATMDEEEPLFHPVLERELAVLCASDCSVWDAIGHCLRIEHFDDMVNRKIFEACSLVSKEIGQAPNNPSLVLQKIYIMEKEGGITKQDSSKAQYAVAQTLTTEGKKDTEPLIRTVSNIILPLLRNEEVDNLIKGTASGDEKLQEQSLEKFQELSRLGKSKRSLGKVFMEDTIDQFRSEDVNEYCKLGIPEVDMHMKGLARQEVATIMGCTGTGKSQAVCGVAVTSMLDGYKVAYASFEMTENQLFPRIVANLTNCPTKDLLEETFEDEVKKRYLHLIDNCSYMKNIRVRHFENTDTIKDIELWLQDLEKLCDFKTDVLIVDYLELVGGNQRGEDTHVTVRRNMIALKNLTVKRNMFTWNVAQVSGNRPDNGRYLRTHNVANSKEIAKSSSLFITMNYSDHTKKNVTFLLDKCRNEEDGKLIEDLPTDFAYGRAVRPDWGHKGRMFKPEGIED